ncbi:MAG: peroxiredoxin [Proteobacteria bacterium]|nr:MAG: peroxiredoxin [Pseudomonadota bacterium]
MPQHPSAGERAPDFTLPSTQGDVALSALLAKSPVLLVFYPGDDTPVCTKQLCNYRDHLGVFEGLGVQVVALNAQSLDSHRAFAEKHRLPFPIASDADGAVCKAYGAAGLFGMTRRALVLIGQDGRVQWRRTDFPIFHQTADDVREAIAKLRH